MFSTIILSFGSFMFVLLLLVVYSFKIKETAMNNKLYSLLLIILLVILGSEILSVYTIYNHEKMPIFNEFICRLHCLSIISWIMIMGLYLLSLNTNYDYESFKSYLLKKIKFKYILVLYAIIFITFFFLKFDYIVLDKTAYLSGGALYYTYIVGIFVLVLGIYLVVKNSSNIKLKKAPILILIIESFITIPVSILVPSIYIVTTSLSFKVFVLYFITENPDLYAIKKLKKTNEIIEKSKNAKTEFLSNVTKEIKLPIRSIVSTCESLLSKEEFNYDKDIDNVKNIFSSSNNLIEIVNNVLDLAKIETSYESLILNEYDLKSLLLELKDYMEIALKNNVKFKILYDENMPRVYNGDRNKIYKILLNLLSNSVKYTEVGKIILEVKYEKNEKEEMLKFVVSDTGIGIKESDYDKMFEKFSRLIDAENSKVNGLGLGLVVTKKLVDIMNGSITFDSKYGGGTNFYIELNQNAIGDESIGKLEESKATLKKMDYLDCSGKKVLLVDDNKLNLKVAEKLLKPYNFDITSVLDGKSCIYKIKEGNIYDIIFLDHMMPEMDGIELLHILKKLSKDFDIPPIIALTANAVTGVREMYLKEGFDDYISKPINVIELNNIINKFFRRDNDG